MKTSLATSLSVLGILATGGVAMAVNTTVLDSAVPSVEVSSPLAEALVPISALSSALSTDSTVVDPPLSLGGVPVSPQFAYDVQGSGTITLEQTDQSLIVVSVLPVTGWTYKSENDASNRVEVEFASGTQRVKFTAELLDGRIVTAVEVDNDADEIDEADEADDGFEDEADDEFEDESDDDEADDNNDDDEADDNNDDD